jgi:alkylated DNA repair dioxygenase AlkB
MSETATTTASRVIAVVRSYDAETKRFGNPRNITINDLMETEVVTLSNSIRTVATCKTWSIPLQHGGEVVFYANLVSDTTCQVIRQEIDVRAADFRKYKFHTYDENRIHFLLHPHATDNPNAEQPGYQYHGVKMKANPLSSMPSIEALADSLAATFQMTEWGVGVDVLLYRNHNDAIGWHADDTQDESVIVSVTVASPLIPRRVKIRPKSKPYQEGDEQIELLPCSGDAYVMDGTYRRESVSLCFYF